MLGVSVTKNKDNCYYTSGHCSELPLKHKSELPNFMSDKHPNKELGFYSEQALESGHFNFRQLWGQNF